MEFFSKAISDNYGNTLFKVTFKNDKGKETVRTISVERATCAWLSVDVWRSASAENCSNSSSNSELVMP